MTEFGNLELINLYSGSKGNCTYVRAGNSRILIDAGGTAKSVESALSRIGVNIKDIKAMFITHEHCDHTHALPVLSKKYGIPVHMVKESADTLKIKADSPLGKCLITHDGEFSVSLDSSTEIEAFFTPHDSVRCVGYRISSGKHSVGVATDLGYVTQRVYDMLRGCDAVMIESNHDTDMVRNGSYTAALKNRILSRGGHLSNDDCAEVAAALARNGTHAFMLAHLSRENNTPEATLETVKRSLRGLGASVVVANQEKITVLVR